ncbi:MAG TPA: NADH-quinone oxidoreductase subunit NuoK, partial [Thermoanaerobaculia bacterium]|nr:NADH-quinone oxidoreductase subunit NuoK [Thermoanaerobaculia bacterium]
MIPTHWFLILSAILFTIGVVGVLTRKNGITIFMSIELMVNAVNLTFLAYARQFHQVH